MNNPLWYIMVLVELPTFPITVEKESFFPISCLKNTQLSRHHSSCLFIDQSCWSFSDPNYEKFQYYDEAKTYKEDKYFLQIKRFTVKVGEYLKKGKFSECK